MADNLQPSTRTGWLWWLAGLITAIAGALIYFIQQDAGNIAAREQINLVLLISSVLVGICIISATSHWWMKR